MIKNPLIGITLVFAVMACSKPSEKELLEKAIEAQKASQFNEALEYFAQFLDGFPKSAKVPEVLYAMGSIYQSQQEFIKALGVYKRIGKEYPDHPTASSACFLVGFIYNNDLKNYDSAKVAYEEFLRRFPASPMSASAKFELENLGKEPEELIDQSKVTETKKSSKSGKGR